MLASNNVDEDKDFKSQSLATVTARFLQLFRTLFSPSTEDQRKAETPSYSNDGPVCALHIG